MAGGKEPDNQHPETFAGRGAAGHCSLFYSLSPFAWMVTFPGAPVTLGRGDSPCDWSRQTHPRDLQHV